MYRGQNSWRLSPYRGYRLHIDGRDHPYNSVHHNKPPEECLGKSEGLGHPKFIEISFLPPHPKMETWNIN